MKGILSLIRREIKLIDNWSSETYMHRIPRVVGTLTGELLKPVNDSLIDDLSNEMQHRELMKRDICV